MPSDGCDQNTAVSLFVNGKAPKKLSRSLQCGRWNNETGDSIGLMIYIFFFYAGNFFFMEKTTSSVYAIINVYHPLRITNEFMECGIGPSDQNWPKGQPQGPPMRIGTEKYEDFPNLGYPKMGGFCERENRNLIAGWWLGVPLWLWKPPYPLLSMVQVPNQLKSRLFAAL